MVKLLLQELWSTLLQTDHVIGKAELEERAKISVKSNFRNTVSILRKHVNSEQLFVLKNEITEYLIILIYQLQKNKVL